MTLGEFRILPIYRSVCIIEFVFCSSIYILSEVKREEEGRDVNERMEGGDEKCGESHAGPVYNSRKTGDVVVKRRTKNFMNSPARTLRNSDAVGRDDVPTFFVRQRVLLEPFGIKKEGKERKRGEKKTTEGDSDGDSTLLLQLRNS